MFSHEGSARSGRLNRVLAAYLASIAGYVNAVGFISVGTFTSHVTGNVGRLANDVATGEGPSALAALLMVIAFFLGSLVVEAVLGSRRFGRVSRAYACALAIEAGLLLVFTLLVTRGAAAGRSIADAGAMILCLAMGLQNGLVTRLSGAVVRTTHLTGIVTDLGMGVARMLRARRERGAASPDEAGGDASKAPDVDPRLRVLATVLIAFGLGAAAGSAAAHRFGAAAMLVPVLGVGSGALYAHRNGRRHTWDDSRVSRP